MKSLPDLETRRQLVDHAAALLGEKLTDEDTPEATTLKIMEATFALVMDLYDENSSELLSGALRSIGEGLKRQGEHGWLHFMTCKNS